MSKYFDGAGHADILPRSAWPTDEEIIARAGELGREAARKNTVPPPASWHTRFIAEQRERGQVQPHLLAMLEVLLSEAEREFGEALPEPKFCKAPDGWDLIWEIAGDFVALRISPSGTLAITTLTEWTKFLWDAAQLAAALRELWPRENAV